MTLKTKGTFKKLHIEKLTAIHKKGKTARYCYITIGFHVCKYIVPTSLYLNDNIIALSPVATNKLLFRKTLLLFDYVFSFGDIHDF